MSKLTMFTLGCLHGKILQRMRNSLVYISTIPCFFQLVEGYVRIIIVYQQITHNIRFLYIIRPRKM